ncbi:MAG: DUF2520 domain-containing protein [Candidatus Aminicenantes bacterium]|nr:DUF2520 domain-containing protein [Candidatus Aminicenantes bacterium]
MGRKFSIIGAGNLGTRLIHALLNCPASSGGSSSGGGRYELKHLYKKSKFGYYTASVVDDIELLVREADIIFICTQESKIREAAEEAAASSNPAGKIFFHTSNCLTSDQLLSLKLKGAYTASFSPLQTFTGVGPGEDMELNPFNGIYFLAEGDKEALQAAREIAGDLGAAVLIVDKDKKIDYHIAAVCASNFLIAVLKLAERQLHKAGEPTPGIEIMFPLIRQTLENVASRGVAESLTGPFKRKEMAIIDKHLGRLEGDEAVLYKALTEFLGKD